MFSTTSSHLFLFISHNYTNKNPNRRQLRLYELTPTNIFLEKYWLCSEARQEINKTIILSLFLF